MRKDYPSLFHDFILSPYNMRDGVVLSDEGCNITNFDLKFMGINPIDYGVTLMFHFSILGLEPHCI